MATAHGERISPHIERYADEQLLYLKYLPTLRRLERRRKLYEQLTVRSASNDELLDSDIERQMESLSEYVGACRAVDSSLIEAMSHFVGDNRYPFYISDYIKARHTRKGATRARDTQAEYVLTALPTDEAKYDGKTNTPLYGSPAEFHASLLGFIWSAKKIYKNPGEYMDEQNPDHESWIFSSTNTIASYLQTPLLAYDEQDDQGNDWVCMSFKNDPDNDQVTAFAQFLPNLQQTMGVYKNVFQVEAHDYESVSGVNTPSPSRMYTLKFSRPIYDNFNVAYYKKRGRPPFSINIPVYIPSRDSSLLLQAGFREDFSELVDPNRRVELLERLNTSRPEQPSLVTRVDNIINQELESYLLKNELSIGPDRLGELDTSITSLEAHRLRTPLTSVVGYAGLVKSLLRDSERLERGQIEAIIAFMNVIEQNAMNMGNELTDSLKAVRAAIFSKQQIVDLGTYFPILIEETIDALNKSNVDDSIVELAMEPDALATALSRLPPVAAIPFSFQAMIENVINNARRYGGASPVRISVFGSVETVPNPDTNHEEEVAYVDIVNYGDEIADQVKMAMNNRNKSNEITSENSKGTGRGVVRSRVAMDLSNNAITAPDQPSIFYQIHNLSEVTDGAQHGVMVRMGFRTLRSVRNNAATKLKTYGVVVNGKSKHRARYLQADWP